jgi:hypothetical protein
MQKHRWAIIAGFCLLALVVVGAIFIPRIFSSSHIEEPGEIVTPGHWWKTDLNEQQLKTLQTLWGTAMTKTQFLEQICPEVLQQLPKEGVDALGNTPISWPGSWEEYEQYQTMSVGATTGTRDEGLTFFEIYLGRHAEEETTFRRNGEPPVVADRYYRISIYMDDVLAAPEYSK